MSGDWTDYMHPQALDWHYEERMRRLSFPPGTLVTYEDEDPANPSITGLVAQPTAAELKSARHWSSPVGPEHGDVLVEWDDATGPRVRTWCDSRDLVPVSREAVA